MNNTNGDTKTIPLFSSKEKLSFLALSLSFALLLCALSFLFAPLQKLGGIPYLVFYYTLQLLKLLYLFVSFGFMFVFAHREGLRSGLCAYLYYLAYEVLFQVFNAFLIIGDYPDVVIVITLFGSLIIEPFRMLCLFLLPYYLLLRNARAETKLPFLSLTSKLSCSNLTLLLLFFMIRMIEQIAATFTFIQENCYGMPSLLTKAEIGSIVFDFAFIPLSLAIAYAVIYVTERKLLQKLEA